MSGTGPTRNDSPAADVPCGSLADLAARCNELHGQLIGALRVSLQSAIEIGALLREAKRQTGHGSFGKWIADNVKFSARTATNYMRLHDNRDSLKSENVSDLSDAYRLLVEHRELAGDPLTTAESEALTECEATIASGLSYIRSLPPASLRAMRAETARRNPELRDIFDMICGGLES
jgi:hypothetical protein